MYGSKIRAIHMARGYDQFSVAEKIGISQSDYSEIENDKKKLRLSDDVLNKIAAALGVSVEDIKSPAPFVIMSFENSPHSGQFNQPHYAHDQQMLNALTVQLAEKDKQLAEKDRQLAEKDGQIAKLLRLVK